MYRVSQAFWVYNGRKLNEPIEGLYVGSAEKRSFMVVRRLCRYVKDFGTRENFEKNFTILNDEIVNILRKLGVIEEVIPTYKDKIRVTLLDESQAPLTPSIYKLPYSISIWPFGFPINHLIYSSTKYVTVYLNT